MGVDEYPLRTPNETRVILKIDVDHTNASG
jgi:hypothetical protein